MRAQKICLYIALVSITISSPRVFADTIASFADPTANGSTPLFTVSNGFLSGSWDGFGLTLLTPISGEVYENVTFAMAPVMIIGNNLGTGTIQFFEDILTGGELILQIDFGAGGLAEPFSFGASYICGNDVTFSGPVISDPLTNETFSFSFANPVQNQNGTSYTAAFTSSADIVPEPAAAALLLVGGALFIRRRV